LVIPGAYEHLSLTKEEKQKMKKDINYLEDSYIGNGNNLEDTKELEDYLLENLSLIGVSVYKHFNFTGIEMGESNDSIKSFKFIEEGSDNIINLNSSIIVTGGVYDVDQTVFRFIHDNRLVYNGRAIVDKDFHTSDKFIFAAGRICEYSQAYTEKYRLMRLERYLINLI